MCASSAAVTTEGNGVPLSKKGSKILDSMTKSNGGDGDKAKRELYASINAGRISGADPSFEKRMASKKKG